MINELKLNGERAVIEENSLFRGLCGNFYLWSLCTNMPAFLILQAASLSQHVPVYEEQVIGVPEKL